jgi:hypothetical protein
VQMLRGVLVACGVMVISTIRAAETDWC